MSYSDGPLEESTGRLLFFLTTMDAAAQDLQQDSRATLTICEASLPGACEGTDPEVGFARATSVYVSIEWLGHTEEVHQGLQKLHCFRTVFRHVAG